MTERISCSRHRFYAMEMTGVSTTRENTEIKRKLRKPVKTSEVPGFEFGVFCSTWRNPSMVPVSVKIVTQINLAMKCLEMLRMVRSVSDVYHRS